jgi:SAM-dependent methyltransferase
MSASTPHGEGSAMGAWNIERKRLVEFYRGLFLKHGDSAQAVFFSSEGQRFRFDQLSRVGDLSGKSVLDVGCGVGALCGFLATRYANVQYTGYDIVPETIAFAAAKYPNARFRCVDILDEPAGETFNYVLISGIFNDAMAGATNFLKQMVAEAFARCTCGLAFNFISNRVNFANPEIAYHDPVDVFMFCVDQLSRKVTIKHHYERCDVVVYVYR